MDVAAPPGEVDVDKSEELMRSAGTDMPHDESVAVIVVDEAVVRDGIGMGTDDEANVAADCCCSLQVISLLLLLLTSRLLASWLLCCCMSSIIDLLAASLLIWLTAAAAAAAAAAELLVVMPVVGVTRPAAEPLFWRFTWSL
jgi:hypothetical protein